MRGKNTGGDESLYTSAEFLDFNNYQDSKITEIVKMAFRYVKYRLT